MNQPTDLQLVQSLRSEVCPSCGGNKKSAHTLCSTEFYRLPPRMRNALYNPLGNGYAEAVVAALTALGAQEFKQ